MRKPTRSDLKAALQNKGIAAMHIGKTGLTKKQQRFAEGIALEGLTQSDAYRRAYNTKGLPATVNPHASRLANSDKIKATIDALTLANQAMEYADAESIRKLVIQSLIQTVIDPEVKPATKVAAAKVLGSVTEVAAFTDRKEITHVRDSSDIREQIMARLKDVILDASDAETVDADALLHEISGEKPAESMAASADRTHRGDATLTNEPHSRALHSNPHERSSQKSDSPIQGADPRHSFENDNGEGDISEDMAFLMLNTETPPLGSEMGDTGGDISGKKRANDNVIINDED
jgi:hypothetical protein